MADLGNYEIHSVSLFIKVTKKGTIAADSIRLQLLSFLKINDQLKLFF